MTSACSVCLALVTQISPIKDGEVSHGLCREHELAALIAGGMCTAEEVEEYSCLRSKYETLTVQVPPHVAAILRDLCAAVARSSSRPADSDLVAGVALSRQLNKMDYEKFPLCAYFVPELRPEPPIDPKELNAALDKHIEMWR